MSLKLNIKSIGSLNGKHDRYLKATFREFSHVTKTIKNVSSVAYFGEQLFWPVARLIDDTDTVEISLYNKASLLGKERYVGNVKITLKSAVEAKCFLFKENFADDKCRIVGDVEFELDYSFSMSHALDDYEFQYPLVSMEENILYDNNMFDENSTVKSLDPDRISIDTLLETENETRKKLYSDQVIHADKYRIREFQLSILIIEARQLVGLDVDPVIRIEVGTEKRYTTIKRSTNSPYYSEYFVFDFSESAATIFDKIITLTALHSYNIPGRNVMKSMNVLTGRMIGQFRCDFGTVFAAPHHQFFHKWAPILHPSEQSDGPQGYIKCDIGLVGKGDALKELPKPDNEDKIEDNLMMPMGLSEERARAVYRLYVFSAVGIPRMNIGTMNAIRKTLKMQESVDVDAYVTAYFLGMKGKTKSISSYMPIWKQMISFYDMFPPLSNRIRIELRDDDLTHSDTIGTRFLNLAQIMDPSVGIDGLPRYGPSYLHFYGVGRKTRILLNDLESLEGDNGYEYRGSVLVSFRTELIDQNSAEPSAAFVSKITSNTSFEIDKCKYLLFCCIYNATLIDANFSNCKIHFEISIGKYGSVKRNLGGVEDDDEDSDGDGDDDVKLKKAAEREENSLPINNSTEGVKPTRSEDKRSCYIDFGNRKPCLYIISIFDAAIKRLFMSNAMNKFAINFDNYLHQVVQMYKKEDEKTRNRLKGVCKQILELCEHFLNKFFLVDLANGLGRGKTDLDVLRSKLIRRQVEKLRNYLKDLLKTNFKVLENLKELKSFSKSIRKLIDDPQTPIPDIFIWMVVDQKKEAYCRLDARHLIDFEKSDGDFSPIGKQCNVLQTLFFKRPNKTGKDGWTSPCALTCMLNLNKWNEGSKRLGLLNYMRKGYDEKEANLMCPLPNDHIEYLEKNSFHLRIHLFQASDIIPSDDTGLSDPYIRVVYCTKSATSSIIHETLNPIWNETLSLDIEIYGDLEDIYASPPEVIIELFDFDSTSTSELLGKTSIKPFVYFKSYEPRMLEWHDLFRNDVYCGEILILGELILADLKVNDVPPLETKEVQDKYAKIMISKVHKMPIEIQPIMRHFKLECILWGIRETKRINLRKVRHVEVEIECSGKTIKSSLDLQKNSNFDNPLHFIQLKLPVNINYWPKINIRCFEKRKLGVVFIGACTKSLSSYYVDVVENDRLKRISKWKKNVVVRHKNGGDLTEAGDLVEGGGMDGGVSMADGYEMLEDENMNDLKSMVSCKTNLTNKTNRTGMVDVTRSNRVSIATGKTSNIGIGSVYSKQTNGIATKKSNSTTSNVSINDGKTNKSMFSSTKKSNFTSAKTNKTTFLQGIDNKAFSSASKQNSPIEKNTIEPIGQGQPHDPAMVKLENKSIRKKRREIINEFDWWTKYFTSKEMQIYSTDEEDLEEDIFQQQPTTIDYATGFSKESLRKLQKEAENKELTDKEKKALEKRRKKKEKARKKAMKMYNINKKSKFEFLKRLAGKGEEDDDTVYIEENTDEKKYVCTFQIYKHELEKEFFEFEEILHTFPLYKGKKIDDDEDDICRLSGKFKGNFLVYPIEDEEASICSNGGSEKHDKLSLIKSLKLAKSLPSSKLINVLVRVYVIRAYDLHPSDLNGKSDPYLILKLGKKTFNEKEKALNNTLDATFGKMFEFDVQFPLDSILNIQVMDHDLLSKDDLIGETQIDLENRFISRHNAACGIQTSYEEYGYNLWRCSKPTQLLNRLCKEYNVDKNDYPQYRNDCVYFMDKNYLAPSQVEVENGDIIENNHEPQALEILKDWENTKKLEEDALPLVKEHVETRSLYNRQKPGVVQGRLEMWIDIFNKESAPPYYINVEPRKPITYELRVIIWNTSDVILNDTSFISGEKSSDIYLRGFFIGEGTDLQSTDVHYRSLDGTGNFNWRFVYNFDYLKAEDRIIFKVQESLQLTQTEYKRPPLLTVQLWDMDIISANDCLGSESFNLSKFPRAATDAKFCGMQQLQSGYTTFNLFRQKTIKGWWPISTRDEDLDENVLVGKVEMEISLCSKDEAEKKPVGMAREPPEPMNPPNRPDTSFLWFLNPWKTLKYIIWNRYKWTLLKAFLISLLIALLVLFIYSSPGNISRKIIGA